MGGLAAALGEAEVVAASPSGCGSGGSSRATSRVESAAASQVFFTLSFSSKARQSVLWGGYD